MAEAFMGIFKTELHRNPAILASNVGHWKGSKFATWAWVSWFNEERIYSELKDHNHCEIEGAALSIVSSTRLDKVKWKGFSETQTYSN